MVSTDSVIGMPELAVEDVVQAGVARDRSTPRRCRGSLPRRTGTASEPLQRSPASARRPPPTRAARASSRASSRPSSRSGYSMRATASAARARSRWRPGPGAARGRRGPPDPSPAQQPGAWWIPAVASALRCSSSASSSVRAGRARGRRLRLGRGGQAQEQPPAQLVVVALVGLDRVAVERGRLPVPHPLAELDELAVLHDRDGLARELPGRDALHRGRERVEVREERPVAGGQRIERSTGRCRAGATARRSAGSAWPRRRPGGPGPA